MGILVCWVRLDVGRARLEGGHGEEEPRSERLLYIYGAASWALMYRKRGARSDVSDVSDGSGCA